MKKRVIVMITIMSLVGMGTAIVFAGSKDCTVVSVKENAVVVECSSEKVAKLKVGNTVTVKKRRVIKAYGGC